LDVVIILSALDATSIKNIAKLKATRAKGDIKWC